MKSSRWLTLTLSMMLGIFCINLLLTYWFDVYGVMRDPLGRRLASSGLHDRSTDDRVSKYLLNLRYVPSNFDGILIGTSSTGNWTPGLIHGYRIYNESLAAGNATEEKTLVEQALPTSHFRIALCVLSPFMVGSHALKEGLGEVRRREVLGSINSFSEEGAKVLATLHLQKPTFFPDGSRELFVPTQIEDLPANFFEVDPQAVADYRSLIQTLQARGIKVVYVVPPLYQPLYNAHRAQFQQFLQLMQTELPEAPIIDFTAPEYDVYNNDIKNFSDGLHMSPVGAVQISKILHRKLESLLGS